MNQIPIGGCVAVVADGPTATWTRRRAMSTCVDSRRGWGLTATTAGRGSRRRPHPYRFGTSRAAGGVDLGGIRHLARAARRRRRRRRWIAHHDEGVPMPHAHVTSVAICDARHVCESRSNTSIRYRRRRASRPTPGMNSTQRAGSTWCGVASNASTPSPPMIFTRYTHREQSLRRLVRDASAECVPPCSETTLGRTSKRRGTWRGRPRWAPRSEPR